MFCGKSFFIGDIVKKLIMSRVRFYIYINNIYNTNIDIIDTLDNIKGISSIEINKRIEEIYNYDNAYTYVICNESDSLFDDLYENKERLKDDINHELNYLYCRLPNLGFLTYIIALIFKNIIQTELESTKVRIVRYDINTVYLIIISNYTDISKEISKLNQYNIYEKHKNIIINKILENNNMEFITTLNNQLQMNYSCYIEKDILIDLLNNKALYNLFINEIGRK